MLMITVSFHHKKTDITAAATATATVFPRGLGPPTKAMCLYTQGDLWLQDPGAQCTIRIASVAVDVLLLMLIIYLILIQFNSLFSLES